MRPAVPPEASIGLVVFSAGAQTLARADAFTLLPHVVLSDRGQQGDEDAEAGEDVEDRRDLGALVVGVRSP